MNQKATPALIKLDSFKQFHTFISAKDSTTNFILRTIRKCQAHLLFYYIIFQFVPP